MATAILIDTDMGVDDAIAVTLGLSADELDLVGLVSVEGNVSLEQATRNLGGLLTALQWDPWPMLGRGRAQHDSSLENATHVHGHDGLGGLDLPAPPSTPTANYVDVYETLIDRHGKDLLILAIGPLTNLAALIDTKPDLLARVGRIIVMGGAVWCAGNVTPHAEFNFYRDPAAAATVLASGLPITVVPLDVTRQVALDESHLAHLARSGTRSGELLARMIAWPMDQEIDGGKGTFLVHDALALSVALWPQLFMRANMSLQIVTQGDQAGASIPKVAKDKTRPVGVVISVNVVDFLENLLEALCHEKFVV